MNHIATDSFASGPMWAGFIVFILTMLAVDLFVLGGRKAHRVSVREALAWVVTWICLALSFAGLLWWYLHDALGAEIAQRKTLEFLAGYLIEQSLSVDNMFVFVMIFGYFAVPPELQRRVLLYGVLGAIVMRAAMILGGVWLVSQFGPTSTKIRCCAGCAAICASPANSTVNPSSSAATACAGRRRCSWS